MVDKVPHIWRLGWRGIEIKLCLGPSSRDPEFAIMKAWTECNLADAAEDVHRAARQCYHEPVEAFMEALMPVNDPTPEGQPEDEDDLQEPRRSFASWLDQRPAVAAVTEASESLAWDVPLTRDDKTELLIQHLMAQEGQNHEEIEELQQAQVDPSRRSSRRWSRASRASSGGWSPLSP
ncbi:unnamed protein product [Durusdinium trenchii]|uniref:Uncharacterized protein n=1 Tax=Durusdinium trenchii TaxID=1381693 RepID=A0ABP0SAN7_9DINO